MFNNELEFFMSSTLKNEKRDYVNRILFFSALVIVILEFAYCQPVASVSNQSKVHYLYVGQADANIRLHFVQKYLNKENPSQGKSR